MQHETGTLALSVVVIKDEESRCERKWTAVALQKCMTASGETVEDALKNLAYIVTVEQAYDLYILEQEPFKDLPKAPPYYWKLFSQTSLLVDREQVEKLHGKIDWRVDCKREESKKRIPNRTTRRANEIIQEVRAVA